MATAAADKANRLRVRPARAAEMLDVSVVTVRRLMAADVFSVIAPRGLGRGKPRYLMRDEVETYALHGEEGVRNLRVKLKRLAK